MVRVGQIITNVSDGLEDNLVGMIVHKTFIRKGPMSGNDIWRITILLSNNKLFEQLATEQMLTILNPKETK
jgi:hypothetical protein